MNDTERKEHLRGFWREVWNERRIDAAARYLTDDVVLHVAGAAFEGRAALGAAFPSQWFDPFPDLHVTVDQQVAEGDRVAEAVTFRGTHSGTDFHPGLFRALGLPPIPARGLPFEFSQISICRFDGSLVAEIWEDFDRVRLFLQLGVELVVPTS
jgi:predicted ester cyclase